MIHGTDWDKKLAQRNFPLLERPPKTEPNDGSKVCYLRDAASMATPDESVHLELPEYDLRRAATASDPLAVVEGYKIEILLRLATLLGVRMCPNCPRCNDGTFGCQDKFGNNMRPGGGMLGGMPALGSATEHQGYGTPHLHAEGHIACAYQFGTLADIVKALQSQSFTFQDIVNYQEWLHAEDVFDPKVREDLLPTLEKEWHDRFSTSAHHDLSQIPQYFVQDAACHGKSLNVCDARDDSSMSTLTADGVGFKQKYFADVQTVFTRVQHHMHKRTKKYLDASQVMHAQMWEKERSHLQTGFSKKISMHSEILVGVPGNRSQTQVEGHGQTQCFRICVGEKDM